MARRPLHLVVTVFDFRTYRAVETVFTKFPISVGRARANDLWFDARSVSARHGTLICDPGSLPGYMDLGSRYGTYIDGVRLEPRAVIPIRDSTILSINPYQLTFHLRRGRPRPLVMAPIDVVVLEPPDRTLWKASLARSEAIRRLLTGYGPSDLLRRAAEVIEVLAECIVLFRGHVTDSPSFLWSATVPDEIVAHLLSPATGEEALRELRDLLTELSLVPLPPGVPS